MVSHRPTGDEFFLNGNDGLAGAIRCGSCGAACYGDDRYCACCGKPLARHCGVCHAEVLQPKANFCTQCGSGLRGQNGGV